ncbi:hypothetical protein [Vibrio sp. 16]|uniref:hypothetical protein n=1 Tax=Vibrio sp. 16 TaxID=391586 RepID=UPI00018F22A1|nr:hypothetical protein [Vibrio sp. 16]EED26474.1 hypothetical protein VPMS16_312 [Vibrio sp. 16]USN27262.1 hypothetical protein [synthetic construct]CAK4068575.1 hypothetical protein VDT1_1230 [Vibrio sp. 16]
MSKPLSEKIFDVICVKYCVFALFTSGIFAGWHLASPERSEIGELMESIASRLNDIALITKFIFPIFLLYIISCAISRPNKWLPYFTQGIYTDHEDNQTAPSIKHPNSLAVIRPLISKTTDNTIAFYVFYVLSWIAIAFPTGNGYFHNIVYSVIAATIFHYIIVAIPRDRARSTPSNNIEGLMSSFIDREVLIFEALNLQLKLIDDDADVLKEKCVSLFKRNPQVQLEKSFPLFHWKGGVDGFQTLNNRSYVDTIDLAIKYDSKALHALMGLDRSLIPEFDAELLSAAQTLTGFQRCMKPYENSDDGSRALTLIRYLTQRQRFVTCYYKSVALYTGAKVLSNYKEKL